MKFYKLAILTKEKKYEYNVKQISCYEWDCLLGLDADDFFIKIDKNIGLFKELTKLMIDFDFFIQFYAILDKNRPYIGLYKGRLMTILYGIHYGLYHIFKTTEKPALVYIEGDNNNSGGDYIKYDYIKGEEWEYSNIIKNINEEFNIPNN